MTVLDTSVITEYRKAQALAQKEKKEHEAKGLSPYPAVLDEVLPETARTNCVELPLTEIPADRIRGTVSAGRTGVLSVSFLPLPEPDSEFAVKWMHLLEANLSDTGIREPVICYEYLGDFYVQEGNKRVSVLKYCGAVKIPARVTRILPADRTDPRVAAYDAFVEFNRVTGSWDVRYRKPGDYARLYAALGKAPGAEWTEAEKQRFASAYHLFREAFTALGGAKQNLLPEDALLLFLKVHPYERLTEMKRTELTEALAALWGDVKAAAEPEALTVKTVPAAEEKKSVIEKIISAPPKHLNVAFILQRDAESSAWTRGHAEGAAHLSAALGEAVSVRCYYKADTQEDADRLLDEAANDGADLIFATTPPFLVSTLRAAVRHPKIRFFNCSECQPLSSVTSYYCRTYEGKFITGLIAGTLADNNLVGYVGSYPILGVPASINAFALGVRMTNPRAKVLLEWSCVDGNPVKTLWNKGVRVISNRDVPLPDVQYMKGGGYGTFLVEGDELMPIASPVWMWGNLYETIVRSVLSGSVEKKDRAVNYWWGMDSGVIDVALSERVPEGVRELAAVFMEKLRKGEFDVFGQRLLAQNGSVISDGASKLTSIELLKMDRLAENVEGRIPAYDELLPMSRALVRELGIRRETD
jgi:basic membrane lipoprotein Med (substrate-binding protein (PBP1-ABC) superfamily)